MSEEDILKQALQFCKVVQAGKKHLWLNNFRHVKLKIIQNIYHSIPQADSGWEGRLGKKQAVPFPSSHLQAENECAGFCELI